MELIKNMTAEQMQAEIEMRGDHLYFDTAFSQWVSAHYGVSDADVQHMVRQEATDRMDDGHITGRGKQGRAQREACLAILNWLTTADEYAIAGGSLRDLAYFVQSHRRACAWAVLLGKAKNQEVKNAQGTE